MREQYIKDCLKDGGCSEEEINACLCDRNRQRRIASMRAKQLEIVHQEQAKLACIDHLCHELRKEKQHGNHKK